MGAKPGLTHERDAFAVFSRLAQRFSIGARQLPAQLDFTPKQTRVCFTVIDRELAVAIENIGEILEPRPCTPLPRVQPWVKGVVNVRGKFLPVVDFAAYLGGRIVSPPRLQRILVFNLRGVFVGLLVDAVRGVRHFSTDSYRPDLTVLPGLLGRYVVGGFDAGESHGEVLCFDPLALVADELFMKVAI